MAVWRRLFAGSVALVAAVGLGACGEDDFENEPRPAAPIEITALVSKSKVKVSPSTAARVGAGIATITISNQSQDPAELTFDGPTDAASDPIPPGGVGSMKIELEQGDYSVSAGEGNDAREGDLSVGAPRESSQNDLLLP